MATSFLSKLKFTFFFFILSFLVSDAQLTYIDQSCYSSLGQYSFLSNYSTNINNSIANLSSKASTTYFNTYTTGIGEDRVNALFYCRYDISPQDCQSCVANTANNVSWCLNSVESLIVYEECSLHYSNRSIFAVMEKLPQLYLSSTGSADEEVSFNQVLNNTVNDLITAVISEYSNSSRYFATSTTRYSTQTIYALAQCNPDINSTSCTTCLQSGFEGFRANFTGRDYGQIFLTSCRFSYILTSDELSPPYRFALTFDNDNRQPSLTQPSFTQPSFTPGFRFSPAVAARGNSITSAMTASIFIVALSLKLLFQLL